MQQFLLTLKNEKTRLYTRLSWLIIVINILFFSYLAVVAATKQERLGFIAAIILMGSCFLLKNYVRHARYAFGLSPFFFLVMLGWIQAAYYWLAGINLVFLLLSLSALRPLTLSFSGATIENLSIFSRKIKWMELNNCLVKDGLLTIDFKNNKLIQQELDTRKGISRQDQHGPSSETYVSNEQEFNDFCRQQLNQ